jgi:hypothetical protein
MPITNMPSAQSTNLLTSANLATALTKQFYNAELHSFIATSSVANEYQSAVAQGSNVKVKIKPNHAEPANITTLTNATELTLASYNRSSYGKIDVDLDYAIADRFVFDSADLVYIDNVATINADVEKDHLDSAVQVMFRKMKRTVNDRLRTSAVSTTVGLTANQATPNAAVFRRLRTNANLQGYQNKTIEVRLAPTFFELCTLIPEFQNISGYVPTAGNTAGENNTMSSTKFEVRGFFNMVLVSDDTYDRPVPASDPIGTAYVDCSAVVPVRGLPVVDAVYDTAMSYNGINMLYQKDLRKINIGRGVAGSLEMLYGFKELSSDINQAGVIQTTPIFQILGGL